MKKKLLAGILALALCSTNMPPQIIFAEEFISGNSDVVSEEETPEIFTNEEQGATGGTDEELSVFSSEEVPEFNDAPDEAMAAAENAQIKPIDLINDIAGGVYTITSAGDYKFTCSNNEATENRIVVNGASIPAQDRINIYLNNVNINTPAGPALQIQSSVQAQVYIYLDGINKLITTNPWAAALQKENAVNLTIDNSPNTTGELIAKGAHGAGIGGNGNEGSGSNITISGGVVTATSDAGAGIGGGNKGESGSNISISGGSVTATSTYGAGIGGGNQGSGSDITISSGSVAATSIYGAGIGSGDNGVFIQGTCSNIRISGGSVTATSTYGAGIGSVGGTCSNIAISGGSVKAYSDNMPGINCTPPIMAAQKMFIVVLSKMNILYQ